MNHSFREAILQATGADVLYHIEDIQSLWSGYGKPVRRNEPRVGRNDRCPCGSGKKYRKCRLH